MINVSVVIPVKNGAMYVSKSINENLENLTSEDEMIFIDDNSTDNTFDKLKELTKNEKRIKVFKNPEFGLVSALNYGVSISKNEWIARADIDDEYFPYRLAEQKKLAEIGISAIFCDYSFIGLNSKNLGVIRSGIFPEAINISLINSERTPHPGVMFNKIAFEKSGGYINGDFPAEDLSLWYRISEFGNLISSARVLFKYTLHSNSISYQNKDLISRKKSQIIKKQPYDPKLGSIKTLLKIYYNYKKFPQSTERRVLYFRDFFYYCFFYKKYFKLSYVTILFASFLIMNPWSTFSILILLKFKIKRKIYIKSCQLFKNISL